MRFRWLSLMAIVAVKHLDIMSKARGRVFTMRGEEKQQLGYWPSARQLFCSALEAFETALSGSPLDSDLLRSCATTMLRIILIDHVIKSGDSRVGASVQLPKNRWVSVCLFVCVQLLLRYL